MDYYDCIKSKEFIYVHVAKSCNADLPSVIEKFFCVFCSLVSVTYSLIGSVSLIMPTTSKKLMLSTQGVVCHMNSTKL